MRKYRKEKSREIIFNTTALPDIIFMLLFFFMVVTVMKEDNSTSTIDLPNSQYADYVKDKDNVIHIDLEMDKETQKLTYYIDNHKILNLASVKKQLLKLRTKYIAEPDIAIKLSVDKKISIKYVNEIKSHLQNNQFYKVEYMIKNMDI